MIKGSNATGLFNLCKKLIEGKVLFNLLTSLIETFSLNVFKYITFRTGVALMTSL